MRQLTGVTAMVGTAHVLLDFSSRPENVPVVRQALAGFADAIALSQAALHDVSTALTEACNNASLHAYAGTEGPVEVELLAASGSLLASVRDHGVGFTTADASIEFPREVDGQIAGIGLPAIHGLASRVRLSERDSGGTEVAMEFDASALGSDAPTLGPDALGPKRLARARTAHESAIDSPRFGPRSRRFARGGAARGPLERRSIAPVRLADTIELEMAPLSTACAVLPRVLYAAGARAYFPVDRLEGLRRVCARVFEPGRCWSPSSRVQAGVRIVPGYLELRVGPIRVEDFKPLVAVAQELDPAIEGAMPVRGAERPERLLLRVPRTGI